MRVLLVEDEHLVLESLEQTLGQEGYETVSATTGEEGFFLANTQTFDLVLLDIELPGRNGLEILRAMRIRGMNTPVILCSVRDGVQDKVVGLDTGADDYMVKPVAGPELLARIRAILRRGRSDEVLRRKCGDLVMDLANRTVTRAGKLITLTAREFELLEYLLRHSGQTVTREMLARDVWQESERATSIDNVIDVHIAHIRKKIDHGHARKLLHTMRGVGFQLKVPAPES
jgi:DNA-binding response OmpR family regulator